MDPTVWPPELWRALWRALPDAFAVVDAAHVRLATPAWSERWPAEGEPWAGALAAPLEAAVREALAGQVVERWMAVGEDRWRLQAQPVPGAPAPLALVAVRPLAANGAAAVRRLEERYHQLLERSGLALLQFDPQGRLVAANRTAVRFFGVRRAAELLGRDWSALFENVAGKTAEEFWADLPPGAHRSLLYVCRTAGGRRPVRLHVRRIEAADGAPRLLVRLEDLSEMRALERRLAESQKMEALGRLAGGIAHDFNNLLTAIQGNAQLLLLDLPPDHPAREEAEAIAQAAARGASLTRQLLAFGRRQPLQRQTIDVHALLRQVHTMLHRVLGAAWTLALELAPELPPIEADPGQLEQALLNLVTNARDAMPEGGRIVVRTALAPWDSGDFSPGPDLPPGRYVMIEVADTGTGIDPELLPQIFEPFVSTKKERGTGLGLAMVYGVVQQMGGGIAVRTAPGRGAAFRLFFPPAEGAAVAEAPTVGFAGAAGSARRGRVLVVEDEPAVRELAIRVLERAGYEVDAASTAAAAQTKAAVQPAFQAAVIDVHLPDMDGRALAAQLRERFPDARIVLVSGSEEIAPPAAMAWLPKPFAPQALLAALEERPSA